MSAPTLTVGDVRLFVGDCRDVMAELDDESIDACVTDPPYELGFMGKRWDATGIAYDPAVWGQVFRVLKPGGHLLAFGGTRTWHRIACAIEDVGFEIRDSIAWLYGSGFPKSLDISKAIDASHGADRPVVMEITATKRGHEDVTQSQGRTYRHGERFNVTAPATEAAAAWAGWGTALKPAHEPVVVARKPLVGTVAANVQTYGTGGLNIEACRIASTDGYEKAWDKPVNVSAHGPVGNLAGPERKTIDLSATKPSGGRWPANVIVDEHAAAEIDKQSGQQTDGTAVNRNGHNPDRQGYGGGWGTDPRHDQTFGGAGGASRFFYIPKADRKQRPKTDDGTQHPTVKPLDLIRHLVRLVTPPGGTVLDPFAGSGTTAEACLIEHFACVTIELTPDYLPLIEARLSKPIQPTLGGDL